MVGESRHRIERVASELLSRRGFNGMGLKAVSEASGLPYGSIYHHFPGGKEDIAVAAITADGEASARLLRSLFGSKPPGEAVRLMFRAMSKRLQASEFTDACSIGTPAQDGPAESPAVGAACETALGSMQSAIADGLVTAGWKPKPAADAATVVLGAFEGATLLARLQRSDTPLRTTADAMARLVEAPASSTGATSAARRA